MHVKRGTVERYHCKWGDKPTLVLKQWRARGALAFSRTRKYTPDRPAETPRTVGPTRASNVSMCVNASARTDGPKQLQKSTAGNEIMVKKKKKKHTASLLSCQTRRRNSAAEFRLFVYQIDESSQPRRVKRVNVD